MTRCTAINTIYMCSQQKLQSACIVIKHIIQITLKRYKHLQTTLSLVGASIPRSEQQNSD